MGESRVVGFKPSIATRVYNETSVTIVTVAIRHQLKDRTIGTIKLAEAQWQKGGAIMHLHARTDTQN